MNSRNHIMFGTVSSWFYRHVCGIDVPKGSKGYDSVTIRPVGVGTPGADLTNASCEVKTPHGLLKTSWTGPSVPGGPVSNETCGIAAEGGSVGLSCVGHGKIANVSFAHYGTPAGSCASGLRVDASCDKDVSELAAKQCVGKEQCTLTCGQTACMGSAVGDPCYGTKKQLAASVKCSGAPAPGPSPAPVDPTVQLSVTIPVGSKGTVRVPLVAKVGLVAATVVITEGSVVVWKDGAYVPGTSGISAAQVDGDGVVFTVVSGSYAFEAERPHDLLVV